MKHIGYLALLAIVLGIPITAMLLLLEAFTNR